MTNRRVGVALLGAAVAAFLARLVMILPIGEPVLFADEAAPFLIARLLVGHDPTPTMGADAFYHAGYSLLLAPGVALFGPDGAWRVGTILNAALLASLVPMVYAFCRRFLDAPHRLALLVAFVTSLFPAFLLETGLTWSESAVLPATLLTLLAFRWALVRGTTLAATSYAVTAVVAYLVHARLLPLLLLAVPAAWLAHVGGHLRRRPAIAVTAVVIVGVLAVRLLHGWVRDRLYLGTPGTDEQEVITRIFRDPGNAGRAFAALLGQLWYLSVATYGLAPLGLWEVGRAAWRRPRRPEHLLALASFLSLMAVSSLFVIDPERVDQRVYGRYAEVLLPMLLAAALIALARARERRLSTVACLLGVAPLLGGGIVLAYGGDAFSGVINAFNILGLAHLVGLQAELDVLHLTVVSTAGAAALLVAGWLPWRFAPALPLLFVGTLFAGASGKAQHDLVLPVHETRRLTSALPEGVRTVERLSGQNIEQVSIAYKAGTRGGEFFGYQLQLDDVQFETFDVADGVPDGPWVIASKRWPAGVDAGARLVFPERLVDAALWVLPGAELEELEARGLVESGPGPQPQPALAASIDGKKEQATLARGTTVDITVVLHQESDRPWPAALDAPAAGTPVRLHLEWRDQAGGEVSWETTADLPRRLLPGESVQILLRLEVDADDGSKLEPGTYDLRYALVQGEVRVPVDAPPVTVEVR